MSDRELLKAEQAYCQERCNDMITWIGKERRSMRIFVPVYAVVTLSFAAMSMWGFAVIWSVLTFAKWYQCADMIKFCRRMKKRWAAMRDRCAETLREYDEQTREQNHGEEWKNESE